MHRLASIQALRGIAALLVATLHLGSLAARGPGSPGAVLADVADNWGHFGVDIFFVISGVIIAMQVRAENRNTSVQFAVRRIARIYPVYWIAAAAMILLLATAKHDNGAALATLMGDPARLFLIWRTAGDLVPPSWSLPYEVNFYAVATLALLLPRFSSSVLWAWAPIQVALIVATSLNIIPYYVFFYPTTLEFILGMAIGYFGLHRPVPRPLLICVMAFTVAILISFAFGGSNVAASPYGRVAGLGLPAFVLVWAAISHEATGGRVPAALRWLGDISYSLYLWHWLAFTALLIFIPWPLADLWGFAAFAAAGLVAALSVSSFSYLVLERPINRFAARVVAKRIEPQSQWQSSRDGPVRTSSPDLVPDMPPVGANMTGRESKTRAGDSSRWSAANSLQQSA